MSLDIYFTEVKPSVVFESNITHNVTDMARAVDVYRWLWGGEAKYAAELVLPLTVAIAKLRDDRLEYEAMEAPNGWGTLEQFTDWLEEVRDAAALNLNANVEISK